MTNRLGLAVIPGAGWTSSDIRTISREAEDAGFDSIFTTEVNNDALATAQLMGSATRRIRVGTWTAHIDLRSWLNGNGPATHLPQRPSRVPVPLYIAALTSRTVATAAAIGDEIMPVFWSPGRVRQSRRWCACGRDEGLEGGELDVTLGIPTFIGEHMENGAGATALSNDPRIGVDGARALIEAFSGDNGVTPRAPARMGV